MKIGIFGGTFDPVHFGHLFIGEWIRDEFALDRIVYIPSGCPPHKQEHEITPFDIRWRMLGLSIDDNPHFIMSDAEKEPGHPSYTFETVRALAENENINREELFLIVGEDSLRDMPKWKHPEEIARSCRVIAARRRGVSLGEKAPALFADALFSSLPVIDISSTEIRERVREGRSIRYMVPRAAEEMIYREGLYR